MTSPPPLHKPPRLPEPKRQDFPYHWVAIGLAILVVIVLLILLPTIRPNNNNQIAEQPAPAEPVRQQSIDDTNQQTEINGAEAEADEAEADEAKEDEAKEDESKEDENEMEAKEDEAEAEAEAKEDKNEMEAKEDLPSLPDAPAPRLIAGRSSQPTSESPSSPNRNSSRDRQTAGGDGISNEDLSGALKAAGAGEGDIQFSLGWGDVNDLDLWVQSPNGRIISFRRPRSPDGGILDIDANANGPHSRVPVENIFWKTGTAPEGTYKFWVDYFRYQGGPMATPFKLRIKIKGQPAKTYSERITPQMDSTGIFTIKFKR